MRAWGSMIGRSELSSLLLIVRRRLGAEMVRSSLRIASLIVAAAVQGGCYYYSTLHAPGFTPSSHIAVTLTEAGSDELARYLGPDALVVRGRYLGPRERGLFLSVESVESRHGIITRWAGETVAVPGEFVREVEERHASASKMVLLTGAAVGALVVAFRAFGETGTGGAGPGGGPPSPH